MSAIIIISIIFVIVVIGIIIYVIVKNNNKSSSGSKKTSTTPMITGKTPTRPPLPSQDFCEKQTTWTPGCIQLYKNALTNQLHINSNYIDCIMQYIVKQYPNPQNVMNVTHEQGTNILQNAMTSCKVPQPNNPTSCTGNETTWTQQCLQGLHDNIALKFKNEEDIQCIITNLTKLVTSPNALKSLTKDERDSVMKLVFGICKINPSTPTTKPVTPLPQPITPLTNCSSSTWTDTCKQELKTKITTIISSFVPDNYIDQTSNCIVDTFTSTHPQTSYYNSLSSDDFHAEIMTLLRPCQPQTFIKRY